MQLKIGAKLTFAMNSVVINICSTDIGSKLRARYQQAPWNTWRGTVLKPFTDTDFPKSMHVCENVCQDPLTCANKRVKDEVIVLDLSVVGHNEWQPGIHTGVPYEVSALHAVGANQFTLPIRYLVQEFVKIKRVELHIISYLVKCKQKVNCISPIGQNRCSLDAQGCCWGPCRNLPTNRRCAEGS